MRCLWIVSVYILNVFAIVTANFACVCNYNIESLIYSSPSNTSSVLGYMYEFDCNEKVQVANLDSAWYAMAVKHRIGYVPSKGVTLDTCAGSPSTGDRLTTEAPSATVISSNQMGTTEYIVTMLSTKETKTDTPTPPTAATTLRTSAATNAPMPTSTITLPMEPTTSTLPSSSSTITNPSTQTQSSSTQTTIKPSPSTTSGMATDSTTMLFVSSARTTAVFNTDGNTNLCQSKHQQHATSHGSYIAQYGDYCYELMPMQKGTWQHGEQLCSSGDGHLVTIGSPEEQAFIEAFLKRHMPDHAVWIGLHDLNIENKFEWTSGKNVSYTNWIQGHTSNFVSHETEDCVALIPYKNGQWDDIPCGSSSLFGQDIGEIHPIMCQFPTGTSGPTLPSTSFPMVTTNMPNLSFDGNTNLCTSYHQQHATTRNNILGQYGQYCYELMPSQKYSWRHGEQICQSGHGHLVNIGSAPEQAFIEGFLKRHMPDHAVWTGLHDTQTESQFEWTSGIQVSYTNWIPGHLDNFADHDQEDCVALIPYKDGKWDDIPCGFSGIFGSDIGEKHQIICQYNIAQSGLIG